MKYKNKDTYTAEEKVKYENAKKFVKEFYLSDKFEEMQNFLFIEEIINQIRLDIEEYGVLEKLGISPLGFYKKLNRLEKHVLSPTDTDFGFLDKSLKMKNPVIEILKKEGFIKVLNGYLNVFEKKIKNRIIGVDYSGDEIYIYEGLKDENTISSILLRKKGGKYQEIKRNNYTDFFNEIESIGNKFQ